MVIVGCSVYIYTHIHTDTHIHTIIISNIYIYMVMSWTFWDATKPDTSRLKEKKVTEDCKSFPLCLFFSGFCLYQRLATRTEQSSAARHVWMLWSFHGLQGRNVKSASFLDDLMPKTRYFTLKHNPTLLLYPSCAWFMPLPRIQRAVWSMTGSFQPLWNTFISWNHYLR